MLVGNKMDGRRGQKFKKHVHNTADTCFCLLALISACHALRRLLPPSKISIIIVRKLLHHRAKCRVAEKTMRKLSTSEPTAKPKQSTDSYCCLDEVKPKSSIGDKHCTPIHIDDVNCESINVGHTHHFLYSN